jgi:hypothetical protein
VFVPLLARCRGPCSMRFKLLTAFLSVLLVLPATGTAFARQSIKKSMWGPVRVNGVSQFPIYYDLGVGIYQTQVLWGEVAPRRPARPEDPADPAYRWPSELDFAIAEASRYGMRVAIQLFGSPSWANGGHPAGTGRNFPPRQPSDFAAFAEAAARRYPSVHLWMVWGEPTRKANWQTIRRERRGRPLTRAAAAAPRLYARILDAAYSAFKRVSAQNLVIGGNTFTTGDISPLNWIRSMRLPNGLPPRMDLYGHNPFSGRKPDLRKPPLRTGFADFSDLDTLARWTDRFLSRGPGRRRHLRLFLSEFLLPTDHENHEFNFWVDRRTQANWLAAALRITRRWKRIYTLGWFSLYDDPPRPDRREVRRGLIEVGGKRKPAYYAYRRG